MRKIAEELLTDTPVGFLTTIDEKGFPHIRAIENLRKKEKFPHASKVLGKYDNDIFNVYISTNTSSKKIKHIKENNNKISLYYCKPEEYKGIMLQGYADIVDDLELKEELWEDGWEKYYSKGFTDPDFTILRLKAIYLKTWYNSRIDEFKLSD